MLGESHGNSDFSRTRMVTDLQSNVTREVISASGQCSKFKGSKI